MATSSFDKSFVIHDASTAEKLIKALGDNSTFLKQKVIKRDIDKNSKKGVALLRRTSQ